MTSTGFTNYKLSIMKNFVDKSLKATDNIKNGGRRRRLRNIIWELYNELVFIEIILQHTMIAEGATVVNFFTNTEMKDISDRLDLLQKTAYNVDWNLTT